MGAKGNWPKRLIIVKNKNLNLYNNLALTQSDKRDTTNMIELISPQENSLNSP